MNVLSFKAAASALLDRMQWARQVGLAFDGARDYYGVLGYDRNVSLRQYIETYQRGGIAKRIVEAFPKATWRGGVELFEDEDPESNTAFEQAWLDLETRLGIWSILQRADILAGLSTYSAILLGVPGEFDQPLAKGNPDQLLYLTPFVGGGGPRRVGQSPEMMMAEADCTIAEFELDTKSPRFGEPLTYNLRRQDVASPMFQRPVHWSRVIHVAEGCLTDNVYGAPTLENVWNLLQDLLKVTGGGAEAFWLRANAGVQFDFDGSMAPPPSDDELIAMKAQAEDYKHQISRMIRTRGVNINQLGSDVANFEAPAKAILTQIAGSKGIPMRILTGSEMGELASSQDAANFNTQVQDRRTSYAGPCIVRRLVDRLIEFGYLPTPKQYEVGWPTVETMTDMEKADGAMKWATTNQAQGSPVYTDAEIREHWHGMAPLTPEQKAEIDAENQKKVADAQAAMGGQQPSKDEEQFPRAAAAADEEMIRVLQSAIECGATDVVERIIGCGY